ncbi:MAG: leucine-rich repeat domain-containing protein [Synergistaceae bacterium]|jgi:hypothetical protein|nr:leucine-rich repeat domain-containing protein [Synergistaceae bacterium]
MRKTVTFMKKAATLAAVLAVFALAISVAWAANTWDPVSGTLTIDERITSTEYTGNFLRDAYKSSGIYQYLSAAGAIPGFNVANIDTVKKIVITHNAAPTSTDDSSKIYGDLSDLGVGGLITSEDMAYLGFSDIWTNLEVIDMSAANTLQGTSLLVANSNDNGMVFAKVREIRLPNGLAVIPTGSFIEPGVLPYLEYIQFPPTLTSIGGSFQNISISADKPLTIVFSGDVPPNVSANAFDNVNIRTVLAPNGSGDVYDEAFLNIDKMRNSFTFVRSIDVDEQQRVLTTLPTGPLSVDVTVSGKNLSLISNDIWIAVDGVSSDKRLVLTDSGLGVISGVEIPRNDNTDRTDEQHTLTVLLDGIPVPDVSVTVTVKPVPVDPNKISITLYTTESYDQETGMGTLKAWAWLRVGESPYPSSVPVYFVVNDNEGYTWGESTQHTGADGRTDPDYIVLLPKGWYQVTAWADVGSDAGVEHVEDSLNKVGIGIGQDATEPTETGGCSAAASPLLLIVGLAAMAWTSKKR